MTDIETSNDIKAMAKEIRRWVGDNNLLRLGGSYSQDMRIVPGSEGAFAMSDEAVGVLERQKVTATGFNR